MGREKYLLTLMSVLLLWGCQGKITTRYNAKKNTMIMSVEPGQTIQFLNGKDHVSVKFKVNAPCTDEKYKDKGDCTISATAPHTRYPFNCEGCVDPEIVVASDVDGTVIPLKLLGSESTVVDLTCRDNKEVEVVTTPVIVAKDATVTWDGEVGLPLTDWKVTDFRPSALCEADMIMAGGTEDCNLRSGVTAGTYTYLVSSAGACPNTGSKRTGTIEVR